MSHSNFVKSLAGFLQVVWIDKHIKNGICS